jgi:hypothetical protein
MKIIVSFSLIFLTCVAAWAQAGFSGSMSSGTDVEIFFESKFEPPEPHLSFVGGGMGVRALPGMNRGLRRYSANASTHEYFGYDIHVDPVEVHTGIYRVTFSALSLTPLEMNLTDSSSWRSLPPPAFPAPQIVNVGDKIALPLFENPATGQKVMDYISLKRHNCDAESGPSQIACLDSLIEEEQKTLLRKIACETGKRDAAATAPIQESQPLWENFRDAACVNTNEAKRLKCKLELTREHTHDIGNVY